MALIVVLCTSLQLMLKFLWAFVIKDASTLMTGGGFGGHFSNFSDSSFHSMCGMPNVTFFDAATLQALETGPSENPVS